MSAPKFLFAASAFALIASACSEPQCPKEYWKDGDTCRRFKDAEVEDGEVADSDGGTLDATVDTNGDGATARDASGATTEASVQSSCPGACTAGQLTACTSSCGTQGTGMCTAQCGAPAAEQCTAPKEVCNWVDDDCDGVVDPGMLKQDTSATRVWTQAGAGASAANTKLLSVPGGGAWWIYHSLSAPGPVRASLLGKDGRPVSVPTTLAGTENTSKILVNSSGKFVTALSLDGSGASAILNLRLYRAADLSLVDKYEVLRAATACDRLVPAALSAIESPDGSLHIAIARSLVPGKSVGTTCDIAQSSADLMILSRDSAGSWLPPKRAAAAGITTNFASDFHHLVRMPCREEWLLVFGSNSTGWTTRVIGKAGNEVQTNFDQIPAQHNVVGVAEMSCRAGVDIEIPVLLMNTASGEVSSYLRAWRVSAGNGRLAKSGPDVGLGYLALPGAFSSSSGRLLMAAIDPHAHARLYEIREGLAFTEVEYASLEDRKADSSLSGGALLLGFLGTVSVVDTGERIVVGISRSVPNTALKADLGTTDPPVAATYALGCN